VGDSSTGRCSLPARSARILLGVALVAAGCAKHLDGMIAQGESRTLDVERRCSSQVPTATRAECWKRLGDAEVDRNDHAAATGHYERAGVPDSAPRMRLSLYRVASANLEQGDVDAAERGFARAGYSDREIALLVAESFLRGRRSVERLEQAIGYLTRGGLSREQALLAVGDVALEKAFAGGGPEFEQAAFRWLQEVGVDAAAEVVRRHHATAWDAEKKAMETQAVCDGLRAAWEKEPCTSETEFRPRVCAALNIPGNPGSDHGADLYNLWSGPDSYIEGDQLVICTGGPVTREVRRAKPLLDYLAVAQKQRESASQHYAAAGLATDSDAQQQRAADLAKQMASVDADPCRENAPSTEKP